MSFFIFSLLIVLAAIIFSVSRIGQSQDNRQQAWEGSNKDDPYGSPPKEGGPPEPSPENCTHAPVPMGCDKYLDNCKGCHEAGIGCAGCSEYEDLVDRCAFLGSLFDKDCVILDESDPPATVAPTAPPSPPSKNVSKKTPTPKPVGR